jgi:opacity protein-like surface antigen
MKRFALAVLCLAVAAPAVFAKDAKPAARGKKAAIKTLKPTIAAEWEGQFNEPTETWTFEKYTPGPDDVNEVNRFYIDLFPSDRPKDVDGYAKKLQADKNFQDMGSLFIKVAAKEKLEGGWLITGTQKDMGDKDDKGMPAFVLYRDDLGVYCRGSVFRTEALRAEAIEACKTLKP